MVLEFEFPDTGEGVTEGKFLEWLVEEGEEIEEDETIAEVETDKAVVDVPAPADGTVTSLKASPGDTIEVGEVIMKMEAGELEENQKQEKEDTEEVEIEPEETGDDEDRETSAKGSGEVLALPKVRRLAEERNIDLASTKRGERITEEEVLDAAEGKSSDTEKTETEDEEQKTAEDEKRTHEKKEEETADTPEDVRATPSVRKLAREKGLDISSVDGTGRGGKITRNDVIEASEQSDGEDEGIDAEKEEKGERDRETDSVSAGESIKLSGVRKKIADRMEQSRFTAPHVTHVDTADVEKLVELREDEKENVDVHLTYLPFIMKATALALGEFPKLNAELDEKNDEIVLKDSYDFNIAVDTDRGLMIPLVEKVDEKSILELAEEVGEKAGKANHGKLSADQMRNGTFSITNLGVIGGEEFTPIINYPQAAILGIGKIQETAEVVEGEVEPRHTVKLSLSYDHRIVDGATAARFVNRIIENLENPEKMLLEL